MKNPTNISCFRRLIQFFVALLPLYIYQCTWNLKTEHLVYVSSLIVDRRFSPVRAIAKLDSHPETFSLHLVVKKLVHLVVKEEEIRYNLVECLY